MCMNNCRKVDILMPVGEKGGVENVVGKTALYLTQRGFQVRVIQLVWEHVRWVPDGVAFYPLMEGRGQYTMDQFVGKYAEFLDSHGMPDLILATTWPYMVLAAKMSFMALEQKCRVVSWLHGPIEEYERAGFGGIDCLQEADAVFVLNRRTEDMLRQHGMAGKVAVVRNPVDFTRCHLQGEWETDGRCLLYVGRLSVEKRIDILLHGLRAAKEKWRLVIVGDGEERGNVEGLVRELALEGQVELLGWKENPWEYCEGVTATVLSSEYECFPVSAVESLACGIPVIAPPVDGITDMIVPGTNGFLYSKRDSGDLARVLDTISAGDVPAILPENCRKSVMDCEESRALADFEEKIKLL